MTSLPTLEELVSAVGTDLARRLEEVVSSLASGEADIGPQRLGELAGQGKVFSSRLLKALRQEQAAATLFHVPGPEPLRRFLRSAKRRGADRDAVREADRAIDGFERLIREHAGDRSSLGAILSAWLPRERVEFEQRRKQTAFRALSELHGASADVDVSTVYLAPGADGRLNMAWLLGLIGLRRLWPGARVKLSTRHLQSELGGPLVTNLDGEPIETMEQARLNQFCVAPVGQVQTLRWENCVTYSLAGDAYGPASAVDMFAAEFVRGTMPGRADDSDADRSYLFSSISVPTRLLVFDVLVHEDVFAGQNPELAMFDTAINGAADIDDPARDLDRLQLVEEVRRLAHEELIVPEAPRYFDAVRHVFAKCGWDPERFRAYRARIEFPLYGTQVSLSFRR